MFTLGIKQVHGVIAGSRLRSHIFTLTLGYMCYHMHATKKHRTYMRSYSDPPFAYIAVQSCMPEYGSSSKKAESSRPPGKKDRRQIQAMGFKLSPLLLDFLIC